ncbi:DUF4345 family protein [Blastococcus sp. LR1]|uniref:DUF4345 family protein n=1 Tax=Blastococcus sp. LR1 TaxID=2877000 RepID=UPI001CCECD53|nr:DUF4345 family protein [Blastococcus sp. LR1]MCA0143703.1 DUF4345 family protein [Blastococcus sp. LR1]
MGDPTVISRLVAGGYAAIGVGAVLRPSLVPAVFGGSARTPESRTEVRAVYAGIPLAFAAAVLRSEKHGAAARAAVLRTVGDASAGMALARLAGVALERRGRAWPTGAFLALEVALAAGSYRAGRRIPPGLRRGT